MNGKRTAGGREGEVRPRQSKRRFWPSFLVLTAVLAVVLIAAYRDGTGFDVLRRYLSYGRAEKVGGETLYSYDDAADSRFAVLGEHLVVLSASSLKLLSGDGGVLWSSSVNMDSPALAKGGGRVVAYDVGGTELHILDESGEVKTLTADSEEPYIAATLNKRGWLAVTAEKQNCKGYVAVYNEALEKRFEFKSRRRFVIDAYVLDDCSSVAAVTLGQEDSVFVSNVVLYDLKSTGSTDLMEAASSGQFETKPKADYNVSGGLVFALREQEGRLAAVSDTSLTFASSRGTVEAEYPFRSAHLREYTLDGDGFTALLLNRYKAGSVGKLVTVATDGTELASLDINEEVQGISAAGRYLAVLYIDRLTIYNEDLEIYAILNGMEDANGILMREDGSVLILANRSASLFLP